MSIVVGAGGGHGRLDATHNVDAGRAFPPAATGEDDLMKVVLANPRGFCAGVYMAIDVVNRVLELCPGEPIYVYHEIVHNRHVVDRFRGRGVTFVDSIADIPEGSIVVFSAHGVSPEIERLAGERQLYAIDATCPLVTKVHMEALRYSKQGYEILLIGHRGHDEVEGTVGHAPGRIKVVESPEEVQTLEVTDPDRLAYLTQTTLSLDDADRIIRALRERFPNIKSPPSKDICYATTNRQMAVRELAPACDLVLVIGSRNSSNSVRLTEIAAAIGTPARLLDDRTEMRPEWFEGVKSVLVTAGASAPEDLVRDIVEELVERFGAQVQQYDVFKEEVEFSIPRSLRDLMRERGADPSHESVGTGNNVEFEEWARALRPGHYLPPVQLSISAKPAAKSTSPSTA